MLRSAIRKRRQRLVTQLALLVTLLLLAVTATAAEAPAPPVSPQLASDLQIDHELGALEDPVIIRHQLEPPPTWPGPRDAQPFDQEPRDAGRDFCLNQPC